jgi:hypothetical protein
MPAAGAKWVTPFEIWWCVSIKYFCPFVLWTLLFYSLKQDLDKKYGNYHVFW